MFLICDKRTQIDPVYMFSSWSRIKAKQIVVSFESYDDVATSALEGEPILYKEKLNTET